jgi:hypothetical protein
MIRRVPSDAEPFEGALFRLTAGECPPAETLQPAIEGTLPQPLRDRIRAHIDACNACRALAAALDSIDCARLTAEEEARIRTRVGAVTARRHRSMWTLAAAAAIAVVASGVWMLQFQRLRSNPPPAPNPPASGASTQAPPAFVLALDVPAIELPPSALALRSGAADPHATALVGAIDLFRRGRYLQAAQRLDALLRTHPKDPFALYYVGLSRLLDGRPLHALEPLDRARAGAADGSWLSANAAWYLAVALERSHRVDQAVLILTQLCGNGGSRGDQACGALGALLAPRIGSKDRATAPPPSLVGADSLLRDRQSGRRADR